MSFAPCRRCDRHVRETDSSCPFCGATGERPTLERGRVRAAGGVTRAAIFYFGASLASVGCGGAEAPEPEPVVEPPEDGERAPETDEADSVPEDEGPVVMPYGAPPDPEPEPDPAPIAPPYGAPPLHGDVIV